MSRKKKKAHEQKGWGWNPATGDMHGVNRMNEVRKRVDHGKKFGRNIETHDEKQARLKAGDVNNMAEYYEAVERGYDQLWDTDKDDVNAIKFQDAYERDDETGEIITNAMGVPRKKQRSLLDAPLINEMPERVTAQPVRTPSYYVVRNGKTIPVYDDDEDLYSVNGGGYGGYYGDDYYKRYGFGQQRLGFGSHGQSHLSDDERGRADKWKEGLGSSYDDWGAGYDDYRKTGVWGGYSSYRAPTLSYRYIEQMANVLAAHYGIEITPGDAWDVDITNKKLTYNPLSLVSGTKADLLLTLIHEIGHIVNTTPNSKLKASDPFDYKNPVGKALFEIPSVFEDMRNDAIMLANYDGADEIYESAQEAPVRSLATRMFKVAEAVREFWKQEEQRFLDEMNSSMLSMQQEIQARPENEAKIKKSIVSMVDDAFRTTPKEDMQDIVARYKGIVMENDSDRIKRSELPNAFDYAGHMLLHGYGYAPEKKDKLANRFVDEIKPYIEATEGELPAFRGAKSTQELFDHMQATVSPKIKDLLDRVMFPPTLNDQISKKAIQKMQANMQQRMQMAQETQGTGDHKMRHKQMHKGNGGSGPGEELPSDWLDGDYQSMKSSVRNEIRTLERFLMNIRREEATIKMTRHEKRGKLDGRSLYRFATGSTRLFKRKLPNVDTVRSFAFSIIIDTSGSMSGDRIVNSTRAAIAFAEAFEKVGIPMEIMRFDTGASIIKSFDVERMDKNQKAKIGGLVKSGGGSTNVDRAFQQTQLPTRPEKNRIAIVITDGGVGDPAGIKRKYVDEFKKQGIQTYGFALDGYEAEIQAMCEQGKGFNLKSPAQIMPHFMDMVKKLMKSARSESKTIRA